MKPKIKIDQRAQICGTKICPVCKTEFPVTGYQEHKIYCTDKCTGVAFFERHGGKDYYTKKKKLKNEK